MKLISIFSDYMVKYFYLPLTLLLIVGGMGIESIWVSWMGMFVFCLLLFLMAIKNGTLRFPPNFRIFGIVLSLFVVNLFTTNNFEETLKYFFLFVGGAAAWLFAFNYSDFKTLNRSLIYILIFLAVFFGQYVIIEQIRDIEVIKSFAITGFSGINRNHHHIGDFFSVIGVLSLYKLIESKNAKKLWGLVTAISIGFLVFSQSRSALLSLVVSIFLFFRNLKQIKLSRGVTFLFFGLSICLLFYFAQYKSLFLSRVYFVEGILGVINNPLGVGMGNFKEISSSTENHIFGLNSFSSVAHNLPLEFLTGMGLMGVIFVYFYVRACMDAIDKINLNPVSALIFINLSVNFFFDFTYAIPTMLWIWFIALGTINTIQKK